MTNTKIISVRANPSGDMPVIHPTAYVDPTAQVIGRVWIGRGVFVGPNAVIRSDEIPQDNEVGDIIVGDECNIQDGVIIHALAGTKVSIGPRTSLAHGAVIHGPCVIGERCFVGFGSVVFKTRMGAGVFVAIRVVVEDAHVPAETFIPSCTLISQDGAGQLSKTNPGQREFMENVIETNLKLARGYLKSAQTGSIKGDRLL